MSKYTKNILKGIDYKKIYRIRKDNFKYLHTLLNSSNELNIDELEGADNSFAYPFLNYTVGLRDYLISIGIYVPLFWKETFTRVNANTLEAEYAEYILPLPIDQRYGISEMKIIVDEINGFIHYKSSNSKFKAFSGLIE